MKGWIWQVFIKRQEIASEDRIRGCNPKIRHSNLGPDVAEDACAASSFWSLRGGRERYGKKPTEGWRVNANASGCNKFKQNENELHLPLSFFAGNKPHFFAPFAFASSCCLAFNCSLLSFNTFSAS